MKKLIVYMGIFFLSEIFATSQSQVLDHIKKAATLRYSGNSLHAIAEFEKILTIDPHNPYCLHHLSELYRATGQFQRGWQLYLHRFHTSNSAFFQTKIDLASVKGKKILIHREGEIGDNILFIRYAKILKEHGACIIAQVHPLLVPLLSLCPYLDEVTGEEDEFFILKNGDLMIWQQNFPIALETTIETIPAHIPYITPDPELTKMWQEKLSCDKKFKIGICWQANPLFFLEKMIYTKRSIPLTLFEKIMHLPGVSFYSLQKRNGEEQISLLSKDVKLHVFDDLDTMHGPFMDTAALMLHLNLVITADTATAHLAGALGIETWVLLPFVAEWRWMEKRNDSPWYPTMRLFRQTVPGNWDTVMEEVKQELKKLLFSDQGLCDTLFM